LSGYDSIPQAGTVCEPDMDPCRSAFPWAGSPLTRSNTSTQSCGDGTFFLNVTGVAVLSPGLAVALIVP